MLFFYIRAQVLTIKTVRFQQKITRLSGIYYFHGKNRCKTCIAVGDVSQNTLKKYFSENKDVVFHEINIEADSNKSIVEEFQVTGSALGIKFSEDKNTYRDDLTAFAFMNAVTHPDTLENYLKTRIENILKKTGTSK